MPALQGSFIETPPPVHWGLIYRKIFGHNTAWNAAVPIFLYCLLNPVISMMFKCPCFNLAHAVRAVWHCVMGTKINCPNSYSKSIWTSWNLINKIIITKGSWSGGPFVVCHHQNQSLMPNHLFCISTGIRTAARRDAGNALSYLFLVGQKMVSTIISGWCILFSILGFFLIEFP